MAIAACSTPRCWGVCVQACRQLNPGSRCREPWHRRSCSLHASARQHGDLSARSGAAPPPLPDRVPAAHHQREKPAGVGTVRYPDGCPCRAFPTQRSTARRRARSSGGPTMAWRLRPCGSHGLITVTPAGWVPARRPVASGCPTPRRPGNRKDVQAHVCPWPRQVVRHGALGVCGCQRVRPSVACNYVQRDLHIAS